MNARQQYKLAYRLTRLIADERKHIQKPYMLYMAENMVIRDLKQELEVLPVTARVSAWWSLRWSGRFEMWVI